MAKNKLIPAKQILFFFIHHPWLKIIALLLAIIIWFYVKDEIHKFDY